MTPMQQSGFAQHDPSGAARLPWAYRFGAEAENSHADSQCRGEPVLAARSAITDEKVQALPTPAPPAGNNWVVATAVAPRLFSPEECTRILSFEDKLQLEAGRAAKRKDQS